MEYSTSYSEATWTLCFYSKHKATKFNIVLFKAKLLGNAVAQDTQTN